MSVEAMTWAYAVPLPGKPCAKSVLVALANRADEDGNCWPGLEDLERRTEWNRRSIQRAVKLLIDRRLLIVAAQYSLSGRQTANLYRLAVGPILTTFPGEEGVTVSPPRVSQCHGEGVTVSPPRVSQCHGEGVTVSPHLNNHLEQSEEPSWEEGAGAPPLSLVDRSQTGKTTTGKPRGHRASVFPEGWELEPWMIQLCEGHGLNPHAEFRDFRNHHLARGSTFKSWPHAFRTWVSRSVAYRDRRQA